LEVNNATLRAIGELAEFTSLFGGPSSSANFVAEAGGRLELAFSSISSANLTATHHGTMTFPNLLTYTNTVHGDRRLLAATSSNFTAINGATITFPSLLTFANTVHGDRRLLADGEGAVISMPMLRTLTGRVDRYDDLFIDAYNGGRIELGHMNDGLVVPDGATYFRADGGIARTESVIHMPMLTSFNGYFYDTSSGFLAQNGGRMSLGTQVPRTEVIDASVSTDDDSTIETSSLNLNANTSLSGDGTIVRCEK
jgi:hypothetical protein